MIKISPTEFALMRQYIEQNCGIHLDDGKEYLIESRLSNLLLEQGCKSFQEFHLKAKTDRLGKLKDRIVDAMTTNETLWFRDDFTWNYLREDAVPNLLKIAAATGKARIWSAAASTGQEAYSLLMLLDEGAHKLGNPSLIRQIEIVGTDISSSALFVAMSARYDQIAISRGLPEDKKRKYFKQDEQSWVFNQELKKRVQFRRFNLQNSFDSLGLFDLVLCRNVIIYFSDAFKVELFRKIARAIKQQGVLLLGSTESIRGYSDQFETIYYKNVVIHKKI